MNEQDVRTFLEDLAHTPPPPSRVDVPRAMATAQRRARTRAWTSAAASVLVVGVAAGLTYAVIDRSPSATGSSVATTAPAPVTNAPRRFDPLIRYASFGWLPEQPALSWRNTAISGDQFALNASEYLPDPANGPEAALPGAYVNVRLYAAGAVPLTEQPLESWSPDGPQTTEYGPVTDAPAVNGAPAYWVSAPGDAETVILKWRYAPDGWAELYAAKLSGDLRETVHRIASALRTGGTERLDFPFHLTGLSPNLVPTASQLEEGGMNRPWSATLDLNTQPDGQGPGVSVVVHPTNASESHEPTTTVDGRPARRETFSGEHLGTPQYSDRLFVDVDGLQTNIFIAATTAEAAAPLAADGVLGIYRTLTLHPDPADWTDQPLR